MVYYTRSVARAARALAGSADLASHTIESTKRKRAPSSSTPSGKRQNLTELKPKVKQAAKSKAKKGGARKKGARGRKPANKNPLAPAADRVGRVNLKDLLQEETEDKADEAIDRIARPFYMFAPRPLEREDTVMLTPSEAVALRTRPSAPSASALPFSFNRDHAVFASYIHDASSHSGSAHASSSTVFGPSDGIPVQVQPTPAYAQALQRHATLPAFVGTDLLTAQNVNDFKF